MFACEWRPCVFILQSSRVQLDSFSLSLSLTHSHTHTQTHTLSPFPFVFLSLHPSPSLLLSPSPLVFFSLSVSPCLPCSLSFSHPPSLFLIGLRYILVGFLLYEGHVEHDRRLLETSQVSFPDIHGSFADM